MHPEDALNVLSPTVGSQTFSDSSLFASAFGDVSPFPSAIEVEAKKKSRSSAVNSRSRPLQARMLSVRLSHCHLTHSARPVPSRFWTPSPPSDVGRHTHRQLTRQLPPLASVGPSQRNPLSIFSMSLLVFFGGANTSSWWIGIAPTTDLTRDSLLGFCISRDFQVGNFSAIQSTRAGLHLGCCWPSDC